MCSPPSILDGMYCSDKKESECAVSASISNFTPLSSIDSNSNLSWNEISLCKHMQSSRYIRGKESEYPQIPECYLHCGTSLCRQHLSSMVSVLLLSDKKSKINSPNYRSADEKPNKSKHFFTFRCQRKKTLLRKAVFLKIRRKCSQPAYLRDPQKFSIIGHLLTK